MFPVFRGYQRSWDMDAIRRSARINATEQVRCRNQLDLLSHGRPSRDPSMGKNIEGNGEDPTQSSNRSGYGKRLIGTWPKTIRSSHASSISGPTVPQAEWRIHKIDMSRNPDVQRIFSPYCNAVIAGGSVMVI